MPHFTRFNRARGRYGQGSLTAQQDSDASIKFDGNQYLAVNGQYTVAKQPCLTADGRSAHYTPKCIKDSVKFLAISGWCLQRKEV